MWGDPLEIAEERVIEYIKAGPRGEEIHWAGSAYDSTLRYPLINCPTLVLLSNTRPHVFDGRKGQELIPKSKVTIY